ncbi:RNA chaperone ProQ [Lacimicrobium alkaliphilum]|uniref:RNA chaperone ProQ n=1 Tax=Lacimicrobium alkaliphilum TaxID=1526571 RepID=A0ABQ1QZ16_9ALTE|nr:RNA chaperone ProQ [Lacimicrobium alkaliphilum]GGD52328.1 RNA chaperone ProQ [Lacimicrobium alkaliphilum]
MDNPQQKFLNSKEVIAFLAETFPACFSTQGDAKPLKIGIFQDLAERLADDERISKTMLRTSLRHYTNSWRYLHAVIEGAHRVDLDGKEDAAIDKEHAEHAKQQLAESKEKAAQRRKENKEKAAKATNGQKRPQKARNADGSSTTKAVNQGTKGTKSGSAKPIKRPPPAKLGDNDLKAGTHVTVKLGKVPVEGTISEIAKEGVHVQLSTGMVVKVPVDTLRLAPPKR